MRIFRHCDGLPTDVRGAAVAIGNFDGVHRGHQAVIGEAGRAAAAAGVPWAVLTFEPHPRNVFIPDIPPFRLTPFRNKARHIEAMGVDVLIVLHFDAEFSKRSAESFVTDVLVEALGAHHVVSGYDFVFGHGRKGNAELLLHMGGEHDFGFTCVQAMSDAVDAVYSSTRVRECLVDGDPAAAAEILGRPFEIESRVEEGDKRGRTIGFPTANLRLGEVLRPAFGVYAVRAQIDDEAAWHDGVANLGRRPTFAGEELIFEIHLFDFTDDIYGRHLRVALLDYLRPEKKFDGLDGLKAQIAADGERARRFLAAAPSPTTDGTAP
jgi:riboflavin kinase/FMN adenylyltransferase